MRVLEKKPKSKHRQEMEEVWGSRGGFDTERAHNGYVCCLLAFALYCKTLPSRKFSRVLENHRGLCRFTGALVPDRTKGDVAGKTPSFATKHRARVVEAI